MNGINVNDIVEVTVTGIQKYGAFVLINNKYDGLIHISEISNGYVRNINDYIKIKDRIYAQVVDIDFENSKFKLSIKNIDYRNDGKFINGNDNYYTDYIGKLNGDVKPKRRKTDKPPCTLCGQDIYEDVIEEIDGLGEDEIKLYRCMIASDGKAKYATTVAQYIVKSKEVEKRFPKEILKLLLQIEKDFKLQRRSEYNAIKSIKETERDC